MDLSKVRMPLRLCGWVWRLKTLVSMSFLGKAVEALQLRSLVFLLTRNSACFQYARYLSRVVSTLILQNTAVTRNLGASLPKHVGGRLRLEVNELKRTQD
ncbi:hypothetical protein TWF132_011691 [Orbilia oligospora]|nr:hypothetical protein TWF751_008443 [Orbilia oligospora]KAF3296234.1 hypothetical protein TWF132_011691 [Orbilia oligospora]